MKKVVLFDMDGTLVPMDQVSFTEAYFGALCKAVCKHRYDPETLVKSVLKGTAAMVKNDGSATNEKVFWDTLAGIYGPAVRDDIKYFDEFYETDFDALKSECGFNERASAVVNKLHSAGKTLVLASNPIFPITAQKARMRWANVDPDYFAHITSYENSHYCKPNPKYYIEICDRLAVSPSDCLMIGNDAKEDLVAADVGLDVFILTDCLINKYNADLAAVSHGDFDALDAFLAERGII